MFFCWFVAASRSLRSGAAEPENIRRTNNTVSIHALREEGDKILNMSGAGATVSIHALREEGDNITRDAFGVQEGFNPRPP